MSDVVDIRAFRARKEQSSEAATAATRRMIEIVNEIVRLGKDKLQPDHLTRLTELADRMARGGTVTLFDRLFIQHLGRTYLDKPPEPAA